MNGQPVQTVALVDVITSKKPGDKIDLELVRGSNRIHVAVKLGRQS